MNTTRFFTILTTLVLFSACSAKFESVDYGHDACTHCKMTIMDKRFAAEILTRKGRAYKFDDIACLKKYMAEEHIAEADVTIFVADYEDPGSKFLDARQVVYLHGDLFKSPMNGNLAAFPIAGNITPLRDSSHTDLLKWENLN
jgi:copper chaperone NosL